MIRPLARRRLARWVLGALVLIHLLAYAAYSVRERQARLLQVYLDGREQWRTGHLDTAAAEFATFVAERPAVSVPIVMFRNFPEAASGWFVLGRVEAERGRVDAALAAFRHSMALEPGRGRREFRDLLLEHGRATELEQFARAELAAEPGSAVAAKDLGAALLATGQPAAAAQAYARALQGLPALLARRDPGFRGALSAEEADLLNLRSVAESLAGDPARAAATCAELTRRQPPGARLNRLCRAYERAAAGDAAASRAELAGYQPPGPEHEALAAGLAGRLPP